MRWTQPDTLVPDPYNPLDWDRYSYARNNPVRYTDPSGHAVREPGDDGPDPDSPVKLVEWYGDEAVVSGRVDIWLDSHDDYNVYADEEAWAENSGHIVPRYEAQQIVQSYATRRALRGEGEKLHQQMVEFETNPPTPKEVYFADDHNNSDGLLPTIIVSGSAIVIYNGIHLSTNNALDAATDFLGPGYVEVQSGFFRSADGLRQVRMLPGDLSGHGGKDLPHINFEVLKPTGQGRFKIEPDNHVYFEDGWD